MTTGTRSRIGRHTQVTRDPVATAPSETWSALVWNLNEAGSAKPRSWKTLRTYRADVALLNEARMPKQGGDHHLDGGSLTLGRDGKTRNWSTMVVSPHRLERPKAVWSTSWGARRAPLANSRPGSWTAAVVRVPGVGDVTAISLYGLLDEKSDASVHRSLSDISPLLEDERYNRLLLLGGDLNTWTGWKQGSKHLARDRVVLDRILAHGLYDCLITALERAGRGPLKGCTCSLGDDCRHTRTRLDRQRKDTPYQMDYLFASRELIQRLDTCMAIEPPADSPSDHFPILATFRKDG
jgi:endonuclease/exonuclease/phosphatase family metal-dependent hydrolase